MASSSFATLPTIYRRTNQFALLRRPFGQTFGKQERPVSVPDIIGLNSLVSAIDAWTPQYNEHPGCDDAGIMTGAIQVGPEPPNAQHASLNEPCVGCWVAGDIHLCDANPKWRTTISAQMSCMGTSFA